MWRSTNWERKGWMTASRFVLILRNSERNNQITPQFKIIAPQLLSHGHPPSSQIGLISTQSFFKIFSQTFGNALYLIFFLMIINHFFSNYIWCFLISSDKCLLNILLPTRMLNISWQAATSCTMSQVIELMFRPTEYQRESPFFCKL